MRKWAWVKLVVLDVLSSPFFGPIGFCRTEALGVQEGREKKNDISIFLSLPRKASVCESFLGCLWKAARSRDRKEHPGCKTQLRGTADPDSAVLPAPQKPPWWDTPPAFGLTGVCRAPLVHSAPLHPGVRYGSGPRAAGEFVS